MSEPLHAIAPKRTLLFERVRRRVHASVAHVRAGYVRIQCPRRRMTRAHTERSTVVLIGVCRLYVARCAGRQSAFGLLTIAKVIAHVLTPPLVGLYARLFRLPCLTLPAGWRRV